MVQNTGMAQTGTCNSTSCYGRCPWCNPRPTCPGCGRPYPFTTPYQPLVAPWTVTGGGGTREYDGKSTFIWNNHVAH